MLNACCRLCSFFPQRTHENYKVFYFKLMDLDVDRFSCRDSVKLFDMCIALEIMEKGTFDGFVIICDLQDATAAHVLKIDISASRRILLYLQEALPVRFKKLHVITMGGLTNLMMSLIKPFIKKELSSLVRASSGATYDLPISVAFPRLLRSVVQVRATRATSR
uniref:CRAL-TRIO domain-containing protein n=1 Tax=Photinus pyralis TaxID=7054 RepID=A0A1Y1KKC1_PHOPY